MRGFFVDITGVITSTLGLISQIFTGKLVTDEIKYPIKTKAMSKKNHESEDFYHPGEVSYSGMFLQS
jgi:hypothetical protein